MVRAASLSPNDILKAMEEGDFYASTGVTLQDYQINDRGGNREISLTIAPETRSKYTVQFIGRSGKILKEVTSSPAVYTFNGDELYVRAKIIESTARRHGHNPYF